MEIVLVYAIIGLLVGTVATYRLNKNKKPVEDSKLVCYVVSFGMVMSIGLLWVIAVPAFLFLRKRT
jgi:hypothetical protein